MVCQIRALAEELGIGQGELLKLARLVSHEGALASVDLLRFEDRKALWDHLQMMAEFERELVAA